MASLHQQFEEWPKRDNLEPIFNSTQDALLFAQIIVSRPPLVDALNYWRATCYNKLYMERCKPDPDPQHMMDLAVRAQLLRECIEEVNRIRYAQSKF